jgi:hypothetical protein
MQFQATLPETKQSEPIDEAHIARMPSAEIIRLRRAHRVEPR